MSTKNIDNSRLQQKETIEDTFSSAKSSDGAGIVKFGVDDLYPERIERLGQYLSDTTAGITTGDGQTVFVQSQVPSIAAGNRTVQRKKNDFPIAVDGFQPSFTMDPLYDIERQVFEAVGNQNFASELVDEVVATVLKANPHLQVMVNETNNTHIKFPGHFILQAVGKALVEAQILTAKATGGVDRWSGVGAKRFPKDADITEGTQFGGEFIDNLAGFQTWGDGTINPMKISGTRWKRYTHPTGQPTINATNSLTAHKFWGEYFDRLAYVGSKITYEASGAPGNLSNVNLFPPQIDSDTFTYKPRENKIEISNIQGADATFPDVLIPATAKLKFEQMKTLIDGANEDNKSGYETAKVAKKSYGQRNSWAAPFLPTPEGVSPINFPSTYWSPYSSQEEDGNPDPTEKDGSAELPRLTDDHFGTRYGPQNVEDPNLPKLSNDNTEGLLKRAYRSMSTESIGDFPTMRMANTRRLANKIGQHRTATTATPSLMLLPKSLQTVKSRLVEYGIEDQSYEHERFNVSGFNQLWTEEEEENEKIRSRYQTTENNRFTPEQVRLMEDQLEAEYMPFYIQDLRTNEIISFHAFLESLEDSYSAEWSAQKGFGRLEAAQIYGGGSRSIGVSFTIVPTSEEDFNDMYIKMNKLTTLVYPQWSEGTLMQSGENKFIQPFSQVPTASPLCRIRVGDLFKSNYSKTNMARMMGIGNPDFKYKENPATIDEEKNKANQDKQTNHDKAYSSTRIITRSFLIARHIIPRRDVYKQEGVDLSEIYTQYLEAPDDFVAKFDESGDTSKIIYSVPDGNGKTITNYQMDADLSQYMYYTKAILEQNSASAEGAFDDTDGIAGLFSSNNPIIKSFESSMGRGIAVAINSIGLDWKLNSVPWNLEPGHRAPRQCTVSLGLIPIHDITPGLDHEGYNRAPIYTVGETMTSVGGDPWYNNKEYHELLNKIKKGEDKALYGEED